MNNQMDVRHRENEQGMAVVIALLVVLIVAAIGSGLLTTALTDLDISFNETNSAIAFYAAESGLQQVIVDVTADDTWLSSILTGSMGVANPFPTTVTINGQVVNVTVDGNGDPVPGYYPLGGATAIGEGSYTLSVFFPPTLSPANGSGSQQFMDLPLRSTGTMGAPEASTQVLGSDLRLRVTTTAVTVWDNAIFAGDAKDDDPFDNTDGNLVVRGSIHVIGDPSDPADIQLEGNDQILNNYDGLGDAGEIGADFSKLPPLSTTTVNGETVYTLEANVKVKNGTVTLNDSSFIGEADVAGNGVKETIDGMWVDGAVTVNAPATLDTDASGSYADGVVDVTFPALTDAYTDPSTGTTYGNYNAFISATALSIPESDISATVGAFHYSDADGNMIDWDPATMTLQIQGIIEFAAVAHIGAGNDGERIYYSGTGTIYADSEIEVNSDLVPVGNYLDPNDAVMNNIGLVSTEIEIAEDQGDYKITVMAAIYAGDELEIDEDSNVLGAMVGKEIDFEENLAHITHVPSLALNLPPGMPGAGGNPTLVILGAPVLSNWYQSR